MRDSPWITLASLAALLALTATCGGPHPGGQTVTTFPGSAVGIERELLERQVARFMELNPGIRVVLQPTPDDATQRHQIYVQRLNARANDPDVLQMDVVWTPEFAAAGWLLPLDSYGPETGEFFPATIEANSWNGRLYALPWFVDVGMLYWRTDLLERAPATLDELVAAARGAMEAPGGPPRGIVWQGARYEGLVTVFLEILGAYGGEIMDADGRVRVDEPAAVRALTHLRDQVHRWGIAPEAVLTWHEEETRFAFQNGTSVFMRNWPYAYTLVNGGDSRVAGRVGVAPMPAAPGGRPTATLGGAQLAVNPNSDAPEAAYALIRFLTSPEQMLERARLNGQFPARPALYDDPRLAEALPIPAAEARRIIEAARPRPVTPIYTQLSEILQIHLHRALVRRAEPAAALRAAAREMRRTIRETGVDQLAAAAEPAP